MDEPLQSREALPADLVSTVAREFRDTAGEAEAWLKDLADLPEPHRVMRSVVHLAGGDLMQLSCFARAAKIDSQDVMRWAEYDGGEERLRDFTQPFPDQE